MYQRALAGYEKALGPDYARTINSLASLGNLHKDMGMLALAEAM